MTEAAYFFSWLTAGALVLWVGICFTRAVWDEWRWRRTLPAHPHTRALRALRDMTEHTGSSGLPPALDPAEGAAEPAQERG